jgi:hypothetical protein
LIKEVTVVDKAQDAATIQDFKNAGFSAGDKAGKGLVTDCLAPGTADANESSAKIMKAVAEVLSKMVKGGASDEEAAAWEKAFKAGAAPHLEKVMNSVRKSN